MGTGPTASHRVVARILLVGDSTACTMLPGLEAVGAPAGVQIENAAVIGCGVVSGQIAPDIAKGRNVNSASRLCQSRAAAAEARALRSGTSEYRPVGEHLGAQLAVGRKRQPPEGAHHRSPQWYAVLRKRMEQRVRQFTATGATVVMLTQPPFVDPETPRPDPAGRGLRAL